MNIKDSKMSAEHAINLSLGFFGVILVLIGVVFVKRQNIYTITMSVGASLIASSIVAYLSSIYIQKYRRAKEISEIWGINSVEEKRTIMNIQIDACTEEAKRHYDIMAFGLKSLRDGNHQGIVNMLERGAKIRILSVDPDCEALKERDVQEKKAPGSTALSIRQLQEWVNELSSKYQGQIQLRLSKYLPSEFYCRVDDSIFVGPYQYGKESQQVITIEFKNPGKAFSYYETYFNSIWNDPDYCR